MKTQHGGRGAVLTASVVGLLHAALSMYWALGGAWLLPWVGSWAVDLVERSPSEASLLLGGTALAKIAAAMIPVAVAFGRLPWVQFWRGVCWIGGPILVLYGGANVAVSNAVLLGLIRPSGGYDTSATLGHAFLWGPLFALWGVALTTWLLLSDRRHRRLD